MSRLPPAIVLELESRTRVPREVRYGYFSRVPCCRDGDRVVRATGEGAERHTDRNRDGTHVTDRCAGPPVAAKNAWSEQVVDGALLDQGLCFEAADHRTGLQASALMIDGLFRKRRFSMPKTTLAPPILRAGALLSSRRCIKMPPRAEADFTLFCVPAPAVAPQPSHAIASTFASAGRWTSRSK